MPQCQGWCLRCYKYADTVCDCAFDCSTSWVGYLRIARHSTKILVSSYPSNCPDSSHHHRETNCSWATASTRRWQSWLVLKRWLHGASELQARALLVDSHSSLLSWSAPLWIGTESLEGSWVSDSIHWRKCNCSSSEWNLWLCRTISLHSAACCGRESRGCLSWWSRRIGQRSQEERQRGSFRWCWSQILSGRGGVWKRSSLCRSLVKRHSIGDLWCNMRCMTASMTTWAIEPLMSDMISGTRPLLRLELLDRGATRWLVAIYLVSSELSLIIFILCSISRVNG